MVCGIYRRHGEGEGRWQLGFCCSPRDKPAGLSLLGEQKQTEQPGPSEVTEMNEHVWKLMALCLGIS